MREIVIVVDYDAVVGKIAYQPARNQTKSIFFDHGHRAENYTNHVLTMSMQLWVVSLWELGIHLPTWRTWRAMLLLVACPSTVT